MPDVFSDMHAWLIERDDFLLIAHVSPDGDTIGSSLALYGLLRGIGKRVQLCCEQPVPRIYAFLPWTDQFVAHDMHIAPYQNAIAIDCADKLRMGMALPLYEVAHETGNIDHHRTNLLFGKYNLIDGGVSATGELIYGLWRSLAQTYSISSSRSDIATCLFTAICTDTGSFSYSSTTSQTFRIAAELVNEGIDIANINRHVYKTFTIDRTHLRGYALSNISLYAGGKIGMVALTQADLDRYHATGEDAEGIIESIRDVDSVEIAIFLREARDNSIKASMRSKEYVDVSVIANLFGGGGHLRAAGCTFYEMDIRCVGETLISAAAKYL